MEIGFGALGLGMLGSTAIVSDTTLTTGSIVIAGLTFVAIFIRHLLAEIKRLTERLDEAKERSDKREAQIEELRQRIIELQKCSCRDK